MDDGPAEPGETPTEPQELGLSSAGFQLELSTSPGQTASEACRKAAIRDEMDEEEIKTRREELEVGSGQSDVRLKKR